MNSRKRLIVTLALNALFIGNSQANDVMSYERKVEAIESLKAYEKNAGSPELVAVRKKKVVPAFICDAAEVRFNCKMQEVMHDIANREEPSYTDNGKYKVDVYFTNDGEFPYKNVGKKHFESISALEESYVTDQIFEYYLGNDFSSYNPEIINVNESLTGLAIFVTLVDQLDTFLDDSRIIGIYHIANNSSVEEGL